MTREEFIAHALMRGFEVYPESKTNYASIWTRGFVVILNGAYVGTISTEIIGDRIKEVPYENILRQLDDGDD